MEYIRLKVWFKDKYRMKLIEKLRMIILLNPASFSLADLMTATYSDSIMELKMIIKKELWNTTK